MASSAEASRRLRAELASELTELARVASEVQMLAPDRDNKATYALALFDLPKLRPAARTPGHPGWT